MLKIIPDPNYMTIGVNEDITFRVESNDTMFQLDDDDKFEWGSGEVTDFKDLGNGVAVGGKWDGPVLGGREHRYSFAREGKYWIIARLVPRQIEIRPGFTKDLYRGVEYFQNVAPTGALMWDPVNNERSHSPDPNATLAGLTRYYNLLVAAGTAMLLDNFSQAGMAVADRHNKQLAEYEAMGQALRDRLESTEDWIRIPITAIHSPAGSGQTAELKVFFAHPKNDGIVKHWKIVDWTHPGDLALDREYEGKGVTNSDAIKVAVRDWGLENQYATGEVKFKVPAHVFAEVGAHGNLVCTGRSWTGSIADFLERAATVLGFLSLILAVVPGGQLLAGVTFVLAGALGIAGAVLNMADRHGHGVSNDTADGLDMLNIAASLMGLAGRWVRCATMAVRMSNGIKTMVLFGDVALDGLQGVLVAVESAGEIQQTIESKSMTPDEKFKKLLSVGASLAVRVALVYVNVKGTMGDISRINTPKPPAPKKGPPGPHGEKLDGSPAENLKKLKDSSKTVDATEDPTVTGDTTKGPHTATVRGGAPRATPVKASLDDMFPKNPAFWRQREFTETEITLRHRSAEAPNDFDADMFFYAHIENGSIHVDQIKTMNWRMKDSGKLVTDPYDGAKLEFEGKAEPVRSKYHSSGPGLDGEPALIPKELYDAMFNHFEWAQAKGGEKITGIDGQFAWANYRAWKQSVKDGMDPGKAILDGSRTGKFWKEQLEARGYEYKMATGYPKDSPDVENVYWKFEVKKK